MQSPLEQSTVPLAGPEVTTTLFGSIVPPVAVSFWRTGMVFATPCCVLVTSSVATTPVALMFTVTVASLHTPSFGATRQTL